MANNSSRLYSFSHICRWLWHTWKGYRTQAALNALLGILLVVADLAFVWATKLAVDIATGTHTGSFWTLTRVAWLLVVIVAFQVGSSFATRWIRAVLGVRAQNRMQEQYFSRLLQSDWQHLRHVHTGDLVNRLEQDVSTVITLLTETLPSFLTTIVQFCGAFTFLFIMDRELALVVVVIAPFFAFCSRLYVDRLREISHDVRESEGRVQSIIQESLQHSLVLKTLERIGHATSRLGGAHRELRSNVVSRTIYSSITASLMNVAFALGYLIAFFWGIASLRSGAITFGALIAFVQLVSQIQTPVRSLTRYIPSFISATTASERLMQLDTYPREPHKEDSEVHPHADSPLTIEVNNLTFAYSNLREGGLNAPIFHDWSVTFEPGSITAVVGKTGAGKTTLINILLGLLHPQQGMVTARPSDGEAFALTADTRCLFSYVPQGNTLLSGTIRDNLLLGNPDATDEEMERALAIAQADFVFNKPNGLLTECSERGGGLSEGQAQRIGLARALLRQAPILLLDEAFASLDTTTASTALNEVLRAYPGRTIIYITHREALLPYANKVIRI